MKFAKFCQILSFAKEISWIRFHEILSNTWFWERNFAKLSHILNSQNDSAEILQFFFCIFQKNLDLGGCYFSKCPANFKCPAYQSVNEMNLPGIEHSAPTISNWIVDALLSKSGTGLYYLVVKRSF